MSTLIGKTLKNSQLDAFANSALGINIDFDIKIEKVFISNFKWILVLINNLTLIRMTSKKYEKLKLQQLEKVWSKFILGFGCYQIFKFLSFAILALVSIYIDYNNRLSKIINFENSPNFARDLLRQFGALPVENEQHDLYTYIAVPMAYLMFVFIFPKLLYEKLNHLSTTYFLFNPQKAKTLTIKLINQTIKDLSANNNKSCAIDTARTSQPTPSIMNTGSIDYNLFENNFYHHNYIITKFNTCKKTLIIKNYHSFDKMLISLCEDMNDIWPKNRNYAKRLSLMRWFFLIIVKMALVYSITVFFLEFGLFFSFKVTDRREITELIAENGNETSLQFESYTRHFNWKEWLSLFELGLAIELAIAFFVFPSGFLILNIFDQLDYLSYLREQLERTNCNIILCKSYMQRNNIIEANFYYLFKRLINL